MLAVLDMLGGASWQHNLTGYLCPLMHHVD
jgi:hypothetical protein